MAKQEHIQAEKDQSTEEKIKEAARKVFTEKGYAATRTRDIAEASGVNLALLNYYFRSKEKLFDIIMNESLQGFMQVITDVINNEYTTLNEKIVNIAHHYTDMLLGNPDIPLFVLTELKRNPKRLLAKLDPKKRATNSYFRKQLQEEIMAGRLQVAYPLHFFMNLISLIVFPFVGSPMLQAVGDIGQQEYIQLLEERKKLIPVWIDAMFRVK